MRRGFISFSAILVAVGLTIFLVVFFRPSFVSEIPFIGERVSQPDGIFRDPTGIRGASHDATRKADLRRLQSAVEAFYVGEGGERYPAHLDELVSAGYTARGQLPVDPEGGQQYEYQMTREGKQYSLCTVLSTNERYCVEGTKE